MNIEVFPSGTLVVINSINISGTIAEISINNNIVQYRVNYFNTSLDQHSAWLLENEFAVQSKVTKLKVGFK